MGEKRKRERREKGKEEKRKRKKREREGDFDKQIQNFVLLGFCPKNLMEDYEISFLFSPMAQLKEQNLQV